jgi:hypothetical protein
MYFLAMAVGQLVGRMFDPIGWILNLALFFSIKAKASGWVALLFASTGSAVVIQTLVFALRSGEQTAIDFGAGFAFWILAGAIECGLGWLIASGVRYLRT